MSNNALDHSTRNASELAVDIRDLQFSWPGDQAPLLKLQSFQLAPAERVFLCGQSGSGKSTLLNLIAGVLSGYEGLLKVLGQDLAQLKPGQRDRLRAEHIGYIFQQFNLLPYLPVLQNITLPCRLSSDRWRRATEAAGSPVAAAKKLMEELGLASDLAQKPVNALSIGQQQRVAAARALIGGPSLVIADEPTSALDTQHRHRFMQQLLSTCAERRIALLFVSHDQSLLSHFDRVVDMRNLNRRNADVLD